MKMKILSLLGFLFLLSWVTLLVQTTSSNGSLWVGKTFADLHFFNSVGSDEEDPATYSGGQITSSEFPLKVIYEKVKVSLSPNPQPDPVSITRNDVVIPVGSQTTHSH
jgi:hypothetical protein